MESDKPCPFCSLSPESILDESPHALALLDGYPVARGHTLVVPRRHVASVFDLSPEEWADLWVLVRRVRLRVQALLDADGMNLGVNDGAAAGQTVGHAHVHLIPRHIGDVPDPRGGVRRVIPERADYWSARAPDE
jgi:diadenosine tetraphosphate (Ap4A) HIT family hydrolase